MRYTKPMLMTLAVAALLWSSGSQAARPLHLDEAYTMALSTHESIRIAVEGTRRAQSGVNKAVSRMLPQLSVDGNYTQFSEQKDAGGFLIQPGDSSRVEVKLSQLLFSGGRERSARKQARILSERSRQGYEAVREDVVLATAVAYYGVLKAEKEIEIKRAAGKRAGERRKVASERYKVGTVTRADLLRAEAELARADAELTEALSKFTDAKNVLKRLTGATSDISVTDPPLLEMPERSIEKLTSGAVDARPDYRQSLLSRDAASEGIRFVKGAFLPSLRLEGLYSRRYQTPQTSFFLKESVSGTIALSYPIFEGGLRRAELSTARSVLREAELRRVSLKRDIEVQVREAYNNLETVKAVIDSYRKQVSFAEEYYRMVFEQFRHGLATTVDVIDSDAALVSAQRSLMSYTYDLESAKLELMYAIGTIMDVLPVQD